MAESLSTEEMDTLLEGVSAQEAELAAAAGQTAAAAREPAGVRPYELGVGTPAPLRLPMLEAVNERVAIALGEAFEALLDRPVEIAARAVESTTYGTFVATLAEPTNVNLLDVTGLDGRALLVCDPSWLTGMTDLLFGGRGQPSDLAGREFSATELRIIQRVVRVFIDACHGAWASLHPLGLEHAASERSARFTAIASLQAQVLVTIFDVRAGDATGRLLFCLPAATLEPAFGVLGATEPQGLRPSSPRWQNHMARRIQTAEVVVAAEFAQAQATVADLLRLKRGDFIELDLKPTATVRVDDIPFFECRYGVSNRRYAVRIQSFLAARDEAASGEPS